MIVAEIGMNFEGQVGQACHLAYTAKQYGADVVKFQLYDADKLYGKSHKYYPVAKFNELGKKDVYQILDYCALRQIECYFSVFDAERVLV